MSKDYIKIWKQNYGEMPKDSDGRTYEIHHIDGNHSNNCIENLNCISIKEHYDIHYNNGDYGACVMIARRMNMSPEYISKIQTGVKRPGVGGVKKGTVSWNKGLNGYKINLTEDGKKRKIEATKRNSKISDSDAVGIRLDFQQKIEIINPDIGKIKRNGKMFTYERAFCVEYSKKYNVTEQYIFRILRGTSKNV
jgi:hypothetical protein